jgi:hypothetical protein
MHSSEELPHLKTFYKVWRRDFKHLKSPKTCRLGLCDICCELFEKIRVSYGMFCSKMQQTNKIKVNTEKITCLQKGMC